MKDHAPFTRRRFVAGSGLALAALGAGGCGKVFPPQAAREAGLPWRALDAAEARALEVLGETLVPGSAAAGLARYVDFQLAGPPADSMLMIRYLGVPPPHLAFYRGGLASLDAAARTDGAAGFADLAPPAAAALVGRLAAGSVPGWSGPPAALFYFVLRSDAIDVVYGTPAGFVSLDVPYMAHIAPPTPWGA